MISRKKGTLCTYHVCGIVQRMHLENIGAVSIKLLSKFHLNPLIVNYITETACICACIHVLSACVSVCGCAHVSP